MSWANSAILAAAVLAAVNVIDSHLISRRLPSIWAFLLPVGVIAIFYGVLTLLLEPCPEGVGAGPVLIAIGSSVLRSMGVMAFLYAMRKEEVSRIIPVVNMHPVFVAMMAVPLLDEKLAALEWLAVVITVAGAVLISVRTDVGTGKRFSRMMILPFLSALCMASANLTSKYALEDISFWNMYAIGAIVWGAVAAGVSARPSVIPQLRGIRRPWSTWIILVLNETLAPVAIILLFWSIERGPVSLVSTIAGTQPVFVFIFAVLLGWVSSRALLEMRMSRQTIVRRFLATAMIFAGVALIHLV